MVFWTLDLWNGADCIEDGNLPSGNAFLARRSQWTFCKIAWLFLAQLEMRALSELSPIFMTNGFFLEIKFKSCFWKLIRRRARLLFQSANLLSWIKQDTRRLILLTLYSVVVHFTHLVLFGLRKKSFFVNFSKMLRDKKLGGVFKQANLKVLSFSLSKNEHH